MNVRERFKRLWRSSPAPDHPLSEEEREEDRWLSADDERARALESFAPRDFDPDDDDPADR